MNINFFITKQLGQVLIKFFLYYTRVSLVVTTQTTIGKTP